MYNNIFDDKSMMKLQDILRDKKQTITFAESCTGGLCASMLTKVSGSSDIFKGSVVTYCNDIKEQELNVKKETMIKYGAVSTQTVNEMLDGVQKKFDADYSIAISGIAGPNGGSDEKPVGTVVIGIKVGNNSSNSSVYRFFGTREEVQIQAAKTAFLEIFQILLKNT